MNGQEREYWRLVKLATARHCEDAGIDRLSSKDAEAVRHAWHEFARIPASHTAWINHDFSVAFAWLREYIRAGEIAAAMIDLDKVRDESRRRVAFWVINQKMGLNYAEPIARDRLHLQKWEAVDWNHIPTEDLCQIAMTVNQRARAKSQRPISPVCHAEPVEASLSSSARSFDSAQDDSMGRDLEPAPF